jgi:hypothetical protein
MPTVRYYTDLDLTDDNSVVNLRDPIALQDAVNKRTLVSAVPLSVPGDILYETANGTAVVYSYQGAAINPDGSGNVNGRAIGLTPGHTIRVTWDVKSTYWTPRAQYIRAYATGGASYVLSVTAAPVDHDGTNFDSFSCDITLPSNATEALLVAGNNNGYSTVWYQNIVYTDLNVVTGARLPIGDAPAVLQVAAGLPAWVVPTGMIEIGFDGGSVPPASGVKADFVIPFPIRPGRWFWISGVTPTPTFPPRLPTRSRAVTSLA